MSAIAIQQTPVVMVVDDEPVVTQTIQAFLELETDYGILPFQSPVAALDAMERTHVDLVIADFLMPEMNGLEFLAQVKRRHPDVIRVLLTGYADKENAIRAINEVELFQYLEKPWDNDQLILVIRNALKNRSLNAQLVDKIAELDRMLHAHDRLSRQHEVLKEELVLARRVQQTMLPQRFPDGYGVRFAATYRPALEVGGDFYDVVEVGDGTLAAFVADATGHGVQAALSTTLLKSAFSASAARGVGADGILSEVNATLHQVLPADIFVAATLVTIDTRQRRVCVANGGGPHPFHLGSAGRVDRLASNGLLLGVVDPGLFVSGDEVKVEFEPGDRVIVYTDGLTEIENAQGEEFGDVGLLDALEATRRVPLVDVCDRILDRAASHAAPGHAWDDVTILAIEMTG